MNARETARQAVKSSVVLLKNEGGVLPLPQGAKVALFGWAQWDAVLSGNGSGAARGGVSPSVVDALKAVGVQPEESLSAWYQDEFKAYHKDNPSEFDFTKIKDAVNSGLMYEIFGKYIPNPPEFSPPQELLDEASRWTDTALWIVGRKSGGEECDRRLENDYYLSNQEKVLLEAICAHFPKVAVVLNGNGLMDLSWVEEHSQIQALLFLGVPGEEGPAALAELLVGKANPSGKLSVTIAKRRNDYPAWEDFSWDKDHPKQIKTYEDYGLIPPLVDRVFAHRPVTAYREDIYLGYRYFDSFGIEPLYPFGFGLSYTSFSLTCAGVAKTAQGLTVKSKIKNTGFRSGREVSQVYVSAQVTAQPHPFQELKAFAKTGELAPGQTEIIAMTIPWKELASFREDRAAWVIEAGTYLVKLGEFLRPHPNSGGGPSGKGYSGPTGGKSAGSGSCFPREAAPSRPGACSGKGPPGVSSAGSLPRGCANGEHPCGSGGGLLGPDGKSAGLPVRGLWLRSALPGLSGDRAALHPSRGWQASHR